jgi:hypothetical protein
MLTLDSILLISPHISFTFVEDDAFLLNTRSNKYFALEEVGAHLWALLKEGKGLKDACQSLLSEYDVEPAQLEQDILELVEHLLENGLVEIAQG